MFTIYYMEISINS